MRPFQRPALSAPMERGRSASAACRWSRTSPAALYWPAEGLLVVADLHLEKGSAFAARGMLLPPYDTAATLERLAHLMSRYAPRTVVALGDNFHDGGGPGRLVPADRAALFALQRGRNWMWIAGNHDPDPGERIGGVFARSLALGALVFRHEPAGAPARRQSEPRRDRRPPAPLCAHPPARPGGDAAVLCQRRPTGRDAGLRGLHGGARYPPPRVCAGVRCARLHGACAGTGTALQLRRGTVPGGLKNGQFRLNWAYALILSSSCPKSLHLFGITPSIPPEHDRGEPAGHERHGGGSEAVE